MSLSPHQLAKMCYQRADKQKGRISRYAMHYNQYVEQGGGSRGGVRGSYADGRPALQDLEGMRSQLEGRPGAPNWIKPIIDHRVSVLCTLPTVTFEPQSSEKEAEQQAILAARAVRGQYELSQMAVGQVNAAFLCTLLGDICYTLDPLRPSDAKKSLDPFAVPGVRINVQDPRHAFPRFGTGWEFNRIQDLFLLYRNNTRDEVAELYPDAIGSFPGDKVDILVFYSKQEKVTVLAQNDGAAAVEAYREDHKYGFCPADWGINRTSGTQFGTSEIDQTRDQHRTMKALFHLAMDGAIIQTFPPLEVHNPEHVGRVRYGPLAIIETVEDGKVTPLQSFTDVSVPQRLLSMSKDNLLGQTGTSPISQDQSIQHANTSGRALQNAQGAQASSANMSHILLGSTLEWLNAKIAMILSTDKEFKNTEMSVYVTEKKGKAQPMSQRVTFKGSDLGGLWRNHVQWPNAGDEHEQEVMYLQLFKDDLVPGAKVLEVMGLPDPPGLIAAARAEKQQLMAMQAQAQGGAPGGPPGVTSSPGGPPGGGPTEAASQGAALGAGAMPGGDSVPQGGGAGPVQPPPGPPPGGMPGFPPVASAPGGPAGAPPPVPDIWSEVQLVTSQLKLRGEIVEAIGTPQGLMVRVTDHRDVAALKTALKPVAEMVSGPGAKVQVEIVKQQGR